MEKLKELVAMDTDCQLGFAMLLGLVNETANPSQAQMVWVESLMSNAQFLPDEQKFLAIGNIATYINSCK